MVPPRAALRTLMATPRPRVVLSPWQRVAVRLLLGGFVLLGATGLFLLGSDGSSQAAAWALAVHVVVGVLLVPLLLVFVVPHAKEHMKRKPVIAFTGALVLAMALVATFTGAQLGLVRASARPGWSFPLHVGTGFGLVLLYALHRRFGSNPAPWPALAGSVALIVGGAAVFGTWESAPSSVPLAQAAAQANATNVNFLPGHPAVEGGGLFKDASPILDVKDCAECHAAIVRDHLRSAHKHSSFNNPFYRRSIEDMRARHSPEATKWCAGCHDPALLFTGQMDDPDLDMDSVEAQAGLTCLSCHCIEPQSILGNGDYVVKRRSVYAWEKHADPRVRKAHDVLLRMKPDAHGSSMTPHNVTTGEFCSVCHKAEIPPELNHWHWFPAQAEYDDWHDSGVSLNNARSFYHPAQAKRCQDCHMPLRLDAKDPAADAKGYVQSHLFAAANTALPYLRGDHDMIKQQRRFLQTALRVDITSVVLDPLPHNADAEPRRFVPAQRTRPAVRPGEIVEAHVVVRNLGVGHKFPAGTIDSNEIWVEFEAAIGDATPFYVSGALDPDNGRVDPTAEFYRSYAMTREGTRMVNRVGVDVYTPVYKRQIGPGTADVVRYRFRVPEGAQGPLRLRARVRYRKFMPPYVDFCFPDGFVRNVLQMDGTRRDVSLAGLPIIDMARGALELPVNRVGTNQEPLAVSEAAEATDLLRVNDLAIAYLLQGDPVNAKRLFEQVILIDPNYADGWVNVGRARMQLLDYPGALEVLRAARRLKPRWGKPAYFEGMIYQALSQFDRAEQAFRVTLAQFPKDRAALRGLAKAQWENDRPKDAVQTLKRLFAINPEDAAGWLLAVAAYKDLGDEALVAAASQAYQRFRPDDTLPTRRGKFLGDDPNLQRLERRIHLHRQASLEE